MDITIVVHHGGVFNMFSDDDTYRGIYRDATNQLFFGEDTATWTYPHIKGLLDDAGYTDVEDVYYRNFDGVMHRLHADEPNMVLTQIPPPEAWPHLHIYVHHAQRHRGYSHELAGGCTFAVFDERQFGGGDGGGDASTSGGGVGGASTSAGDGGGGGGGN